MKLYSKTLDYAVLFQVYSKTILPAAPFHGLTYGNNMEKNRSIRRGSSVFYLMQTFCVILFCETWPDVFFINKG
jgi:hypothetical protein